MEHNALQPRFSAGNIRYQYSHEDNSFDWLFPKYQ